MPRSIPNNQVHSSYVSGETVNFPYDLSIATDSNFDTLDSAHGSLGEYTNLRSPRFFVIKPPRHTS